MKRPIQRASAGPALGAAGGLLLFTGLLTTVVTWQSNLRPGFNLFSVSQDVQLGRQNSEFVEKQLPLLDDEEATRYLSGLGRQISAFEPNPQNEYVWQFKLVNSSDINAFALPGGYIYVNRATIESVESEAQLAGVLAHEEGHVVLRHGTHQATETLIAQAPLDMLSGIFGQGDTLFNKLVQYGVGAGVQSLLLKNSRSMEAEADAAGTYALYRAGYDPRAMAHFFELVEQKYPQQTQQFLSDHPSPGSRIKAVADEIPELGPEKSWNPDSPEFESVRRHLTSLPPAPRPEAPKPS